MSLSCLGVFGIGMVRMACAAFDEKISIIISPSNAFDVWSKRWCALIRSWRKSSILGFGLKPSIQGTQRSSHTLIDLPSPKRKHAPFSIGFLAFSIALQVGEADFLGSALSQSSLTVYFDHKTSIQSLCLLEATIQTILARSAAFTYCFFKAESSYTFRPTKFIPFFPGNETSFFLFRFPPKPSRDWIQFVTIFGKDVERR